MQFIRATSTAALILLLGTIVPAYAQHDQENEREGKPEKRQDKQQRGAPAPAREQRPQAQPQQQNPRQEAQQPREQRRQQPALQQQPQQRPAQQAQQERPRQQQEQPHRQVRQQQQPQRTQQQAAAWQQQRGWLRQGGWQEHSTWQQGRAQRWENDHRSWARRGGYGGHYIPRDRFSLSFGNQHWFRMHSRPTMYMGYPRFWYSGFSFLLVDPWPEYWAENWYDTDDVYIDYDEGYYLYNRRSPSIRLAISVVL